MLKKSKGFKIKKSKLILLFLLPLLNLQAKHKIVHKSKYSSWYITAEKDDFTDQISCLLFSSLDDRGAGILFSKDGVVFLQKGA
ncbi:hypothetical protein ThvES_00008860 [Thiovulum sp. ES]|nr:hypothetical protein ThvES_00008860 [Thiovulum sp. ES]